MGHPFSLDCRYCYHIPLSVQSSLTPEREKPSPRWQAGLIQAISSGPSPAYSRRGTQVLPLPR